MLFNPGGPGAPGLSMAGAQRGAVSERFDQIGWDPRGVGASEPAVRCLDDKRADARRQDLDIDFSPPGIAQTEREEQEYVAACAARMTPEFLAHIGTRETVRDMDVIRAVLGDPKLPHLFFVDGGALAVENALKVAFDWKSRYNEAHGIGGERSDGGCCCPALGTKVLHLTEAFHGRSGYTMSLTNTDPNKVARFPKFDWPRIDSPYLADGRDMDAVEERALEQGRRAFADNPHDIACFIAEPIQGEGGDHHFRPQFLQAMQELCHANDALFVMDEVQTGVGLTGSAWAFQQLGVTPDVVAFGKKAQVCGVMAGGRVDEVADNVFAVSSRINSTWGGNLTDMVRSRRILEVIERDRLIRIDEGKRRRRSNGCRANECNCFLNSRTR